MTRKTMPLRDALQRAKEREALVNGLPDYDPDSIYCPSEQAMVVLARECETLRSSRFLAVILGAVCGVLGSLAVRLLF